MIEQVLEKTLDQPSYRKFYSVPNLKPYLKALLDLNNFRCKLDSNGYVVTI